MVSIAYIEFPDEIAITDRRFSGSTSRLDVSKDVTQESAISL